MSNEIMNQPVIESKENSTMFYCIVCSLFLMLFIARDIFYINVSYYLISLAAVVIVAILPVTQIPAFVLSVYIFSNSGLSGVFAACMFLAVLVRLFPYLSKLYIPFMISVLIIVFELMHAFYPSEATRGEYIDFAAGFASFAILTQMPSNKIDLLFLQKSFFMFMLFFVIMSFIQMMMIYGSLLSVIEYGMRTKEYNELVQTGNVLMANQNYLTVLCATGVGMSIMLFSHAKKNLLYICALAIFIFIGLLTISKMFICILGLLAIFLLFSHFKKSILRGIMISLVIVAVTLLFYRLFEETLIAMVLKRFETGDLTTGRFDINNSLIDYMNQNFTLYLTGIGMKSLTYVMIDVHGNGIHSALFEILGAWGVPGILMVSIFIYSLIRKLTRENKTRFLFNINALPLLIVLAYALFGMIFSSQSGIARLIVCIYALGLNTLGKNKHD